jgi:hypothetical protein
VAGLLGLPIGAQTSLVAVLFLLLVGVCWTVTRLVLKGKLVPRQSLEDIQADRNHYRKIADDSLAMATKLGMSVEKLTISVERLTSSAETSNHALVEIQAAVTERRS